jgi:hypothetical protein
MSRRIDDVSYEELPALLPERIPELEQSYEAEVQRWSPDAIPPHVAYGDLLNPYLVELFKSGDNPEQVARAFAFIEQIATHPDAKVRNVAAVTIVERVVGEDLVGRSWTYMGEETRKLAWEDITGYPEVLDQAKFHREEYVRAWEREVDALGGIENLTVDAILNIRSRLYPKFGIKVYPRA